MYEEYAVLGLVLLALLYVCSIFVRGILVHMRGGCTSCAGKACHTKLETDSDVEETSRVSLPQV